MKTTSGSSASTQALEAGDGVLVTSEWLAEHLSDPAARVIEIDVSRADYDQWHIDGAVLWNVYQDLKDSEYCLIDTAGLSGSLPAPGSARTRRWCSTGTRPRWVSGS
jgi:3-mercaptopyruvate sulfurtransferase SseA